MLRDKVRGGRNVGCCGFAACPAAARHMNKRDKVRGGRNVGCCGCPIEQTKKNEDTGNVSYLWCVPSILIFYSGQVISSGNHVDYVGLPPSISFLNLLA